MSDPRASITRSVLAPPRSAAPRPPVQSSSSSGERVEEVRLIGKPHGRMRCVNLSLTPEAKQALYARAEAERITLGEALMDLAAQTAVAVKSRRLDRTAASRRGVPTVSVFVLLTPGEAREIVSKAERSGRSVSDYASRAVTGS